MAAVEQKIQDLQATAAKPRTGASYAERAKARQKIAAANTKLRRLRDAGAEKGKAREYHQGRHIRVRRQVSAQGQAFAWSVDGEQYSISGKMVAAASPGLGELLEEALNTEFYPGAENSHPAWLRLPGWLLKTTAVKRMLRLLAPRITRCQECGGKLNYKNYSGYCSACQQKLQRCSDCGGEMTASFGDLLLRCRCGATRSKEMAESHSGNYGMPKRIQNRLEVVANY